MRRLLLALICLMLSAAVSAQQRMEILSLRHRLPEQVLPTLQGLLEPGGSVSAMSGKIIVRSSPGNIAELRQALEAIDQPVRRLLISVRQGGSRNSEATRIGADGRVILRGDEVDVRARADAESGRRSESENIVSRVQTVEDGEALIQLGQSVPVPATQTVYGPNGVVVTRGAQYVSTGSGFMARPRLAGNNVTVSIAPQSQRMSPGGRIEGSGLQTTVSGRLGEWIPLGGVSQQSERTERGLSRYGDSRSEISSDFWIRVEALD
ncbi:secretin N-terminal domain-containing protein [Uliginosibacterium paludis]|uniref:Secretin N-terminal domain-containing protein n=1 Tax=Uliginosibacterium paludis TaxID=1615952 RepID=A0ABV2CW40_9RHOO